MPRGNLECIEPRALSLSQLASLVNSLSYFEAFDLARKQRINLNLFVDHDANMFLKNIDVFIKRFQILSGCVFSLLNLMMKIVRLQCINLIILTQDPLLFLTK